MTKREQYEEFLVWLKAKQKEIASIYWNEPDEARQQYRLLLLKIQSETWATETRLREINA